MEIKIIGFDADDTLWVNEPYYREAEKEFCDILTNYISEKEAEKALYKTEMQNLDLYGYGAKGFMLSLIETAIKVSNGNISSIEILNIIAIGKKLLQKPIVLLDGVENVLKKVSKKHKLIIATKGDLLDQERKLKKSGLAKYFHHIEIMSNKNPDDYQKLLLHLEIKAEEFLMIGNSLKSDIFPVISLGGKAIHVPYHTTWIHEEIDGSHNSNKKYMEVETLSDILELL